MLFLVIGVLKLLKPNCYRQSKIEKTKRALGYSCKSITELNLVKLG
jgi:hypothetical protein